MRTRVWLALLATVGSSLGAQGLARTVTSSDGSVQVLFPARPNVCGDGETFIRTSRGRGDQFYSDYGLYSGRNSWSNRPCGFGPVRVLALVMRGEITRLSVFVGPVPQTGNDTRTVNASATDAAAWLVDIAARGESRVAAKALQSLMFADAPPPWNVVLRIARDNDRPRDVRRNAVTWLAYGVTEKLGLADVDEHATDDDEMRSQAVFVLTQQRKTESVPELIDLVRTAKHPVARKAAIFWLGQSGDTRAVDVYAELLGLR